MLDLEIAALTKPAWLEVHKIFLFLSLLVLLGVKSILFFQVATRRALNGWLASPLCSAKKVVPCEPPAYGQHSIGDKAG